MTDVEKRVRAAFDSAHVPPQVAQRTLERIEALRAEEEAAAEASHAAASADPAPRSAAQRVATPAPPRGSAPGTAFSPHPAAQATQGEKHRGQAKHRRGHRPARRARLAAALAACAVLLALGIGGVAWAVTPCAYVTVDVNPSLELGINRLGRVASTRAYNNDGARVLAAADVQGDTYEDAMTALEAALQSYIASGAAVELAVVCDDGRTATMLENVGTRCLEASGGQVHCSHATADDHHAASELEMGVARYRVYRALVDAGVDLSADDARSMSMRELLDLAQREGVQITTHGEDPSGNGSTAIATGDAGHAAGNSAHQGEGHGAAKENRQGAGEPETEAAQSERRHEGARGEHGFSAHARRSNER